MYISTNIKFRAFRCHYTSARNELATTLPRAEHQAWGVRLRAERSTNRHNKEAAETSKRQRLDEESAMDYDDGASQDEEAASTGGGDEGGNNEGGDEDGDNGGSDEDVNDKS